MWPIYRSRYNYWSCSKFAQWLLKHFGGGAKPDSATSEGWKAWRLNAISVSPAVYWFVNTALDNMQNVVCYPTDVLRSFCTYWHNRFVSKIHYLPTALIPGKYYEVETRMLHGLFETLVNFVEVECAWHHVACDSTARSKYPLPWWAKSWKWLRWGEWRCAQAGIDYLNWEMTLVNDYEYLPESERASHEGYGSPTHQAISASEQWELYNWWKNVRPNRPDPYEVSGWSATCSAQSTDDFLDSLSLPLKPKDKSSLDMITEIEAQYEAEDEQMMIRLIKLRQTMWT